LASPVLGEQLSFAGRNVAPLADIDASWKAYIEADADWNANLMSAIVGLSRHYDEKRSEHLEVTIQDRFSKLDNLLAVLRNSEVVKALREGRTPNESEIAKGKALSGQVKEASDKVNLELYKLVRCIVPPGQRPTSDTKINPCR
jgi:hypothetical protein